MAKAKSAIPSLSLAAGVVVIIASTLIITSHPSTAVKPAAAAENPQTNVSPTPNLSQFFPGQMLDHLKVISVAPNSPINTVTFKGLLTLEGKLDENNCLQRLTASSSAQLPLINKSASNIKICFKTPTRLPKNQDLKIKVDNLGINQSDGNYQATFVSVVK